MVLYNSQLEVEWVQERLTFCIAIIRSLFLGSSFTLSSPLWFFKAGLCADTPQIAICI
jgi:hypothetical protein